MSKDEMQALRNRVKYWAADGRFERFKTTKMYDGVEGRKQHEYPLTAELPVQSETRTVLPRTGNMCSLKGIHFPVSR